MPDRLHFLLIDINAIGYAAMYQSALNKLSHQGESTAALVGGTASVLAVLKRHPDAVPLLLWDGPGDQGWRRAIHPGYKTNRADTEDKRAVRAEYARQSPELRRIFLDLGIPQVICPTSEADDLAGHFRHHLGEDHDITLLTRDHDWLQAVGPHCVWESSHDTGKRITLDDFATLKEGAFAGPDEYLTCKIIAGDTSDAIDGVPGVGLATALKHLRAFGNLETLYAAVDAGEKRARGKQIQSIAAHRETIARNRLLMDWRHSAPVSEWATVLWAPTLGRDRELDLEADYGLKRLAAETRHFDLESDRPMRLAIFLADRALMRAGYPREEVQADGDELDRALTSPTAAPPSAPAMDAA